MSSCRACVPSPYSLRICSGSRGDVEGVAGVHLHAIGQLERLDARFELRVVLTLAGVAVR